jgi:hypothetical protein
MRYLLYILIGLIYFRPAMVAAQDLPAWFINTPASTDMLYAVGYARAYEHADSAIAMAVRDADHQINLALSTKIYGERLFQTLPGGRIVYQGEIFREEPIRSIKAVYLDTVQTEDMILILAASRPPNWVVPSYLTSSSPTPPGWVTELPESTSCMYALGVAPGYYYPEHSWLAAERQARQELAYSFQTRQRQVMRSTKTSEYGVTASATAVHLQNLQVVARWQSETIYFVLIKGQADWSDE